MELRQGPTYLFRDDNANQFWSTNNSGTQRSGCHLMCVWLFEYEQQHKLAIGRLRRDPMKHLGYVLGDIERVVENC